MSIFRGILSFNLEQMSVQDSRDRIARKSFGPEEDMTGGYEGLAHG